MEDDQVISSEERLAQLLEHMRGSNGFPALSAQMVQVQQVASSETDNLNRLTDEILKDVALTNKLLRLVNSVDFAHRGGVNTVSRAIGLIGFVGVRNLATGLMLLEHMENRSHASQLRGEFLRSLYAATLATDLCHTAKEREQVFLGAMFHSLGRLLTEFYFPDVAKQVRERCDAQGVSEFAAARQSLGVDYETLGMAVAKMWGLPEDMVRLMEHQTGEPPSRPVSEPLQHMRWISQAANDLADTMLAHDESTLPAALEEKAKAYSACLRHSPEQVRRMTLGVRAKLAETAQAIGLVVPGGSKARRLLHKDEPGTEFQDTLSQATGGSVEPMVPFSSPSQTGAADASCATDILARGVEDVTLAMVDGVAVNDVMRMILEVVYRALGAQRVLFALKEPGTDSLTGRFGMGDNINRVARSFRADMKVPDDLFGAVCRSGRDTLMRDVQEPKVVSRLPAWHKRDMPARSLLLLPMQVKSVTFAAIYVDKAEPNSIHLSERDMNLLKTLRNQAVMAMRQGRG